MIIRSFSGDPERASIAAPDNTKVLLCMARVRYELENYGLLGKFYQQLKKVDTDLADQFFYLYLRGEEATRAVDKKE